MKNKQKTLSTYKKSSYSRPKYGLGGDTLSGAASGLATGAAIAPPFGAIAGTVIGAAAGLFGGKQKQKAQEEAEALAADNARKQQATDQAYADLASQGPQQQYNAMFKKGGRVKKRGMVFDPTSGNLIPKNQLSTVAPDYVGNPVAGQRDKGFHPESGYRDMQLNLPQIQNTVPTQGFNPYSGYADYQLNLPTMKNGGSAKGLFSNQVPEQRPTSFESVQDALDYYGSIGTASPVVYDPTKSTVTSKDESGKLIIRQTDDEAYKHLREYQVDPNVKKGKAIYKCGGKAPRYDMGGMPAMEQNLLGQVPIEVEGGEMLETPMGQDVAIEGPSHAQGGVPVDVQPETRVYSDKLKVPGTKDTFAKADKKIVKDKTKHEKVLEDNKSTNIDKRTSERMLEKLGSKQDKLFAMQQLLNGDSNGEGGDRPVGEKGMVAKNKRDLITDLINANFDKVDKAQKGLTNYSKGKKGFARNTPESSMLRRQAVLDRLAEIPDGQRLDNFYSQLQNLGIAERDTNQGTIPYNADGEGTPYRLDPEVDFSVEGDSAFDYSMPFLTGATIDEREPYAGQVSTNVNATGPSMVDMRVGYNLNSPIDVSDPIQGGIDIQANDYGIPTTQVGQSSQFNPFNTGLVNSTSYNPQGIQSSSFSGTGVQAPAQVTGLPQIDMNDGYYGDIDPMADFVGTADATTGTPDAAAAALGGSTAPTLGGAALGALPGLVNMGRGLFETPETIEANTINPAVMRSQRFNVDPQLRANRMSSQIANRNIRNAARTRGELLGGYAATSAARGRADSDAYSNQANMNAQYAQQADQFNASSRNQANQFNARENARVQDYNARSRAATNNMLTTGLGQIAGAGQQFMNDKRAYAIDQQRLSRLQRNDNMMMDIYSKLYGV